MTEDFVTRLRLQLREAALEQERSRPLARARAWLPAPLPLVAGLAVALLALAVVLGARSLRTEPPPAAPRLVHTLKVADGLTSISSGFGAAWATDLANGQVLRIDPATGRVVARIPAAPTGRQSDVLVSAGAGAVWALSGDLENGGRAGPVVLLRIDPKTNRVVKRIPMRVPRYGTFSPEQIQIADDRVWVVGAAGALRIDPATNTADRFVPIADPSRGVVAEGDALWLLTAGGRLRQIDADTRRTVQTTGVLAAPNAHLLPGAPGLLTIVDQDRVTVVERADGRALWRARLGAPARAFAPSGDDALWAFAQGFTAGRAMLVRLDAGDGHRLGAVALREPGTAGIAEVGREAWVASPDGAISVVR